MEVKKKRIIGYTTGVFDLFHIGHLNILKEAKSACDYLIVGITTDELCYQLKEKQPIIEFSERYEILKSIKFVDEVVVQKRINEIEDYKNYNFNKIFKGSDWKGSRKWNKLENEFKNYGVEVIYFPYTKNTSSTIIREVLNGYRKKHSA